MIFGFSTFILLTISYEIESLLVGELDAQYFYKQYDTYYNTSHFSIVTSASVEVLVIDLISPFYIKTLTATLEEGESRLHTVLLYYRVKRDCKSKDNTTFLCNALARLIRMEEHFHLSSIFLEGHETRLGYYIGCFYVPSISAYKTFGLVEGYRITKECLGFCETSPFYSMFGKPVRCICFTTLSLFTPVELSKCIDFCLDILHHFCGKNYIPIYRTRHPQFTNLSEDCITKETNCDKCPKGRRGRTCDIIDCTNDNGMCGTNKCLNHTVPKFISVGVCVCRDGFTGGDLTDCKDIDECIMETVCPGEHIICENTIGSFTCNCHSGYEKEASGYCDDINECTKRHDCHQSSTLCLNTDGSYVCMCKIGFTGETKFTCKDINECGGTSLCNDLTTTCANTYGSYKCECRKGFRKLSQFNCEDINECLTLDHNCGKQSTCFNIVGSFRCDCPDGTNKMTYHHVIECQDIDECQELGTCNLSISFCLNTLPGYICHCLAGYVSVNNVTCKKDIRTTSNTTTRDIDFHFPTTELSTMNSPVFEAEVFGGLIFLLVLLTIIFLTCLRNLVRSESRGSTISSAMSADSNATRASVIGRL